MATLLLGIGGLILAVIGRAAIDSQPAGAAGEDFPSVSPVARPLPCASAAPCG